jgi:hypothetical protein
MYCHTILEHCFANDHPSLFVHEKHVFLEGHIHRALSNSVCMMASQLWIRTAGNTRRMQHLPSNFNNLSWVGASAVLLIPKGLP